MMEKIFVSSCLLLIVTFLGVSKAACPASCECSETEISCDSIDSLPTSDELFSTNKQTVQTVSITGSAAITAIPPDYFVELPALTSVTLSNNGLTGLDVSSFKYLPMFKSIDLSGNPIVCSNVNWVKEWLASFEENTLMGMCTDPEEGELNINDYTDFIADVVPERLTFPEEVIEIMEDMGATSTTVNRLRDDTELYTKVITKFNDGTTDADVQISLTELTFPEAYLFAEIPIQVVDNEVLNTDPRGFTITVYAESILIGRAEGIFNIIDNEVPTTKSNTTQGTSSTTAKPDDGGDGGGNAGKLDDTSSPPSTAKTTEGPPVQDSGSKAWIIIIIIILIIVLIVVGIFIYKRMQERKRTTAKKPDAGYTPVKPEGDAKVYNPTTEELA